MKESIGNTINNLQILEIDSSNKRNVICKCVCGKIKSVDFYDLRRDKIKSCGCLRWSDEIRKKSSIRAKELQKKGILKIGNDQSDEYTKFRYLFKCINNKNRKTNDISLSDLKYQWETQQGYCIYSNISLILPTHKNIKDSQIRPWQYASIDRIDSNKYYTKDNIQFISRTLNYAKNSMSTNDFLEFLNILVETRGR